MDERYSLTTDPDRLAPEAVHALLAAHAYWAAGRSLDTVRASMESSLNFGALHVGGTLAGFSRVVSDYATFAWLCDVVVHPEHRGRGLSRALMEAVVGHPRLQGLKRFVLATRDAMGLYEKFGFGPLPGPELWMTKLAEPS
jgi:GNAT superfamily N-acetyltransferase